MMEEAKFPKEAFLEGIDEELKEQELQVCQVENWLIFSKTKFDWRSENGEPFRAFELLLNLENGEYMSR